MCVLVALTLGCVRVLPPLRRNNPFGVARGQLFEPVLKLCAGDTLLRGWRKRQSQRSGGRQTKGDRQDSPRAPIMCARHVLVESKVSVTSLRSSLLQPAARLLRKPLEGRTHRHVRGSVSTPCRSTRSCERPVAEAAGLGRLQALDDLKFT